MCSRIDGLPHDTWGNTLLPFQGVLHLRGARLWGKKAQGQVPLIRKNDNIKE